MKYQEVCTADRFVHAAFISKRGLKDFLSLNLLPPFSWVGVAHAPPAIDRYGGLTHLSHMGWEGREKSCISARWRQKKKINFTVNHILKESFWKFWRSVSNLHHPPTIHMVVFFAYKQFPTSRNNRSCLNKNVFSERLIQISSSSYNQNQNCVSNQIKLIV